MNMNDAVKSAGRVLDLLELFSGTMGALGVSEVARQLDIPKSSAKGLLGTLAGRGYLAREGVAYVLPPELRDGRWVGGLRARLLAIATPALHRMAQRSGESAFLGAVSGNEIQYLAKALSAHEVRYDASLSKMRPMYCTSMGIAILAHLEPEDSARILATTRIKAITRNTVTNRDAILRMMERARRDGYAEIKDANVMGASGVAAPVYGPRADVVAALSIGAPTSRYTRIRRQLTEIVVGEAAGLSRQLSATGGANGSTQKT